MNMQMSNIFHYFSQNMVGIITGKYLGVETLGSLNIATNLAIVPAQKIQSILTSVLSPAFCSIQGDIVQLKKLFRRVLFTMGVVFIPLMAGMSAVSVNLVIVVYGAKWEEAGMFLGYLAVVGLCKGFEHLMRAVIIARGWGASAIARITFAETVVGVPLLFAGVHYFGVAGLIAAYLVSSLIACTLSTRAAERAVEEQGLFFAATSRTLLVAFVMFISVAGLGLVTSLSPQFLLPLQITIGVLLYIAVRIRTLTGMEREVVRAWPIARFVPSLR
jgi:O-antigen/teichoic acid export membrane protein